MCGKGTFLLTLVLGSASQSVDGLIAATPRRPWCSFRVLAALLALAPESSCSPEAVRAPLADPLGGPRVQLDSGLSAARRAGAGAGCLGAGLLRGCEPRTVAVGGLRALSQPVREPRGGEPLLAARPDSHGTQVSDCRGRERESFPSLQASWSFPRPRAFPPLRTRQFDLPGFRPQELPSLSQAGHVEQGLWNLGWPGRASWGGPRNIPELSPCRKKPASPVLKLLLKPWTQENGCLDLRAGTLPLWPLRRQPRGRLWGPTRHVLAGRPAHGPATCCLSRPRRGP